jgi:hypothetical protein
MDEFVGLDFVSKARLASTSTAWQWQNKTTVIIVDCYDHVYIVRAIIRPPVDVSTPRGSLDTN